MNIDQYRKIVRQFPCPFCDAKEGEPCWTTDYKGGPEYPTLTVHDERSLVQYEELTPKLV